MYKGKTGKFVIRWVLVIILCCSAAVIGGLRAYVWPTIDKVRSADAVLILGGVGTDRYSYGVGLAAAGFAPNVVLSNPGPTPWISDWCRQQRPSVTVYCFVPEPATTAGETRAFLRLAKTQNWTSVIVVTSMPHVSRARYILSRCFDGEVMMTASPDPISKSRWAYEFFYQTGGYLRALFNPSC